MPTKLSERLPMQLSHEEGEGWKMDTVDLANWLVELAQLVEGQQKALVDLLHAVKKLTNLADTTDQQVLIQTERLNILEGKRTEQPPVDRRLVEEALAMCKRFDSWLSVTQPVADIRELLRRALEGDSNAKD